MLRDQRLRKSERLHGRLEHDRVFQHKCSAADSRLIVYVAKNDLDWSRLGISVSRRIGNAVRRSLVRRRIREAFRTSKPELPRGIDLVCIARPPAGDGDAPLAPSLVRLANQACRRLTDSGAG